jgi:hypothetical protein
VIAPVLPSVRPAGSDPAVTVQLFAVPPEVPSWKPYAVPTFPFGSAPVTMFSPSPILIVYCTSVQHTHGPGASRAWR